MTGETKASRRTFLKVAGGALGASVLACSGVAIWGTHTPGSVDLIRSSCMGRSGAVSKVLVAYASKAGSTAEVADAVGQAFCKAGIAVDVRRVQEVKKLDGYDAVVLGTAIRMQKPLGEATRFAKQHSRALAALPVACFSVSLTMVEDTPEQRATAMEHIAPLVAEIGQPLSVGLFAGKMDYDKLSPFFRFGMSMDESRSLVEGDWRNWEAIGQWADELAAQV